MLEGYSARISDAFGVSFAAFDRAFAAFDRAFAAFDLSISRALGVAFLTRVD